MSAVISKERPRAWKLRHRGGLLVDWLVTFTAAAYNLIRLRTLLARPA